MHFISGTIASVDTKFIKKANKRLLSAFAFTVLSIAANNACADEFIVQPVQLANEDVRYQHGHPTIDIRTAHGAVEINPLPLDHGRLAFSVAIFNASDVPITVGIENFSINAGNQVVSPFSVDELISKAKSRAGWSKFGTALGGVLAASIVGSTTDTSYATVYTPRGAYTASVSTPSVAGQIESGRIMDNTVAGMAAIQDRLDATRARLGDEIVQTSTIDPGRTYGGKLVFQKLRNTSLPQTITLTVGLNGDQYAFTFQLAKPGSPAPPIRYAAGPVIAPSYVQPPVAPAAAAPPAPAPAAYIATREPAPAALVAPPHARYHATAQLASVVAPAQPGPRLLRNPVKANRDDWGLVEVPSQLGY
jgi:hypothetical protein